MTERQEGTNEPFSTAGKPGASVSGSRTPESEDARVRRSPGLYGNRRQP